MSYFTWNADPDIFTIGSFPLRWYSLCFMSGIFLGFTRVKHIWLNNGKTNEQLSRGLPYFIFGTILGARIGHCLFYEPGYYLMRPWEIIIPPYAGLASHGGVLGIVIAMWLFVRKEKEMTFTWLADSVSLGIAIGVPFIRLGNFINSEIIGNPTTVPWAIIFERVDNIPRHPAQLYEALAYFATAAVLNLLYATGRMKLGEGRLIGLMFVLIFAARFFIEFVKIDQVAFEQGMYLNMGQLLSIPAVALGLFLVFRPVKS